LIQQVAIAVVNGEAITETPRRLSAMLSGSIGRGERVNVPTTMLPVSMTTWVGKRKKTAFGRTDFALKTDAFAMPIPLTSNQRFVSLPGRWNGDSLSRQPKSHLL